MHAQVDAQLTRDHLARLLAEENSALDEFESLLDREHVALGKRDIDALEALADSRQASISRMLKLEDERRSLCSMLGYDTDLAGLARLIAWCDPQRTLLPAFDECSTRARKCRDLILSQWYRALWPALVLVRSGETSFANSATGTREGIAFGSLTSQRGDRLIIDDPHSTETAESAAERTTERTAG